MTENFFRTLELRVQEKETLLCIGLDPHVGQLPEPTAEAVCTFCLQIISETSEYAALYKPNAAFFEQFGPPGVYALQRVISAVPSGIPILLDCKRGDIDTTAEAYATSAYKILGADAVTLSPYMGWDSVRPFVTGEHALKGAFVLCKTSNPSANDLQTCETGPDGDVLYEQVVQLCNAWNAKLRAGGEPAADAGAPASSAGDWVGVVAGATDLDALQRIRSLAPDMWILCPGVGAQGGEPEKVCPAGLRADGSGLLISVSRSISLKAAQGPGAMAAEAQRLRDEINALRAMHVASIAGQCLIAAAAECATEIVHTVTDTLTATLESAVNEALPELAQDSGLSTVVPAESMAIVETGTLKDYQQEFLAFAIAQNALQFGSFTLKSGRVSPYFFNAGCFHSGASLATISRCYARAIHESGVQFDVLFGPAYKGIPLATAVAMALYQLGQGHESVEVGYNRKEVKDHGEGGQLVGATVAGRRVLIVDDVITAGTAIREAVQLLRDAGAVIVGVAVCLDRQERVSGESSLSAVQQVELEFGFPVLAVVRLQHLVHYLAAAPFSLTGEVPLTDAAPANAAALLAQASVVKDIDAYRLRYGVHST